MYLNGPKRAARRRVQGGNLQWTYADVEGVND